MFKNGCMLTGIAVGLQAFGHHLLKRYLMETQLSLFSTATTYLLWGGLWLMVLGLAEAHYEIPTGPLRLLLIGLTLFCGSLYLYACLSYRVLIFITPLGGASIILSFLWLGTGLKKRF